MDTNNPEGRQRRSRESEIKFSLSKEELGRLVLESIPSRFHKLNQVHRCIESIPEGQFTANGIAKILRSIKQQLIEPLGIENANLVYNKVADTLGEI